MKFTTSKKLNIGLNTRLKKIVFALLIVLGVLILIYPFYPQPYSDIYYEVYSFIKERTNSEDEHYVVAETPHYVWLGTKEEKLARDRVAASRVDALGVDWNSTQQAGTNSAYTTEHAGQLIIDKIGVDMPIAATADSAEGLAIGAWLIPGTSTPDKSSNTAIAGHRFQHLPPSSKTLYLLDKLEVGDEIVVYWQSRKYTYQMSDSEIVLPEDLTVLNATSSSRLTLITCTPIFSTEKRLIVTANLISVN